MDPAYQHHELGFCKWVLILLKLTVFGCWWYVFCPILYSLHSSILTIAFWIYDAKEIVGQNSGSAISGTFYGTCMGRSVAVTPSHHRSLLPSLKPYHLPKNNPYVYLRVRNLLRVWACTRREQGFSLWVEDEWWGGWWGISTLTNLKIQFVAARSSGDLRQVRFSVGCFGGSVFWGLEVLFAVGFGQDVTDGTISLGEILRRRLGQGSSHVGV